MLSSDPKHLKLFGIDLRPRWRRRVLVVITYLVYEGVMIAGYRRVAFPSEQMIDWVATACVIFLSIFGLFSPLKSFEDVRVPVGGKLFAGWKNPRMVMLGSLDDWSKYKYGNVFDEATEEQQKELLRTYRVGNYLVPFKGVSGFDARVLDERELAERNEALRKTLKFLILALIIEATNQRLWTHPAGGVFLELLAAAATAPKAIVLWSEADPREREAVEITEPV
jgi:hypothetical protein